MLRPSLWRIDGVQQKSETEKVLRMGMRETKNKKQQNEEATGDRNFNNNKNNDEKQAYV